MQGSEKDWLGLQKKHPAIEKSNEVNSPEHYASGKVECIDAIEASMSLEAFSGYCKGNCIKYLWRYIDKGGVQSLEKCRWYLNRLLEAEKTRL
jgi:hypothetical protein